MLYLGIASDEVEAGVFVGNEVKLNLKSVEGPGEVYLYSTDTFGKPTVMFNSADGISESDTFVMKAGAHSHQSMAFSEAGVYRVGFDFSGKLAANGEETRSGEFQLLFEVEGASSNDLIIDSFSTAASPFSLAFQTESDSTYKIEASHDSKKWGEIGEGPRLPEEPRLNSLIGVKRYFPEAILSVEVGGIIPKPLLSFIYRFHFENFKSSSVYFLSASTIFSKKSCDGMMIFSPSVS